MARLIKLKEYETEGERSTAGTLVAGLPEEWVVIYGAMLVGFGGVHNEVDFFVVGRHGVYLVDDKSFNGKVVAGRGNWETSFGSVENPVEKAEMVAKKAAGQIREGVAGVGPALGGAYFLHAYISLSGQVDLVPQDPHSTARVVLASQLCQALAGFDRLPDKQALPIADFRDGIVDYLTAGRNGIEPPGPGPLERLAQPEEPTTVAGASASPPTESRRTSGWLAYMVTGLVALAVASVLLALAVTGGVTPWQDAASHHGQRVWVKGPVITVKSGGEYTYLNIGRDYPNDSRFSARIRASDLAAFETAVGNVGAHYEGKTVEVLGIPTASTSPADPHTYVALESPNDIKVVGALDGHLVMVVLAAALALAGAVLLFTGLRRHASVGREP